MDHLEHFGLSRDPFSNDPQVAAYFESPEHADAAKRLLRAVGQHKGLCLFTGPAGSGKSMVIRHLLEELEEEVYEASVLVPVPGVADGHWVMARLAAQLGVEEPATDRSPLLAQVYDQLAIVREDGRHAVVFVDETQVLAERDALGDLRVLLNLEYEERRLLTLVLVGTPELAELVADEPGLAERMEVHVRMRPLDEEGATQYLVHRIRRVGGSPAILEAGALPTLIERAGGVPRRLNNVADNALYEAYLAGRVSATVADVERAAADLDLGAGMSDGFDTEPPPLLPAQSMPDVTDLDDVFAQPTQPPIPRGMPDATMPPGHGLASATMLMPPPEDDTFAPGAPPKEDEIDDLFVDLVED